MELQSLTDYKIQESNVSSRNSVTFETIPLSDATIGEAGFQTYPSTKEELFVINQPSQGMIDTIFHMMNSLLGAGILGVPYTMHYCGIIPSVLILAFITVLSHISTIFIIHLRDDTNAAGLDEMGRMILGKYGSIINTLSTMIYCNLCMVAFLIIGSSCAIKLGELVKFKCDRRLFVLVYSLLLPIPLTFPKTLKILQMLSYFNFLLIIMFCTCMVVKGSLNVSDTYLVWKKIDVGYFECLGVYTLAFALSMVVIPLVNNFKVDTKKKDKASVWAFSLTFIFVVIPGIFGYIMFGDQTKDNILLSFSVSDPIGIIGRITFFIIVDCSYPSYGQTVMCSWSQILFQINNHQLLNFKRRVVVIIATNIIPLSIAILLKDLQPALSVGGSVGGALAAFIFPSVMWIVHSKQRLYSWRNILCILFCVFGLVTMCVSGYMGVISAIKSFRNVQGENE